jgi:hypothetical protein
MKFNRLFTLVLIGLPFLGSAQKPSPQHPYPIDSSTGLWTYAGVTEVAGLNAADAYVRAGEWVKSQIKDPASFYTLQDAAQGKMEGKYRIPMFRTVDKQRIRSQMLVKYTLTLWFKDGRYRYKISNLNLERATYYPLEQWLEPATYSNAETKDYTEQVHTYCTELIASLNAFMAKAPAQGADEDDW